MYELQAHFPYHVEPADNGKVTLTIQIESMHVQAFLQMLDSLSAWFRVVNSKAKVALAYTRLDSTYEQGEKYFDQFRTCTIDTFKQLRHETAYSPRELISLTLQYVKEKYPNASYTIVKDILTKSGELKKSGFYKKNF